jgi:hypothetical protein
VTQAGGGHGNRLPALTRTVIRNCRRPRGPADVSEPKQRGSMTLVDPLTADDYASVTQAARVLHERGWRKQSVNEMTDAWRQLVEQIERGYSWEVEEYTNDLSCRDLLALAWPMLTENVRAHRKSELDELDARFRTATTDDHDGRLARFYRTETKDGWWWRRIPLLRRGQFARDLDG